MHRWLCLRWLALVACLPLTGCFNGLLLKPTTVDTPVEETVMVEANCCLCRNKIAIIDVSGMIQNCRTSGLFGDGQNPTSLFKERLDAVAADSRVKAVVLRINSPGGGVTASDIMYTELLRFKKKTGKPVVACMMDLCASGAFYLAMGADVVYAHPTTVTGSIGVIMELFNASGLAAKIGIASNPIKSGPIKDVGNPFREMTDEERAILQTLVNSFYDQFVKIVCTGRRMDEERVRALADGRVFGGVQAKELGLVDEIGYLEDAIECAKHMAHVNDAAVVSFEEGGGYKGSIYAGFPNIPSNINLHLDVPGLSHGHGASFMYMWEPGGAP
jgi:protease-4